MCKLQFSEKTCFGCKYLWPEKKKEETHQNNSPKFSYISLTAYLHTYFVIHNRNSLKILNCQWIVDGRMECRR